MNAGCHLSGCHQACSQGAQVCVSKTACTKNSVHQGAFVASEVEQRDNAVDGQAGPLLGCSQVVSQSICRFRHSASPEERQDLC
eukprot:scaffold223111_cov15-Tisochrysis_lutea.AAC.2